MVWDWYYTDPNDPDTDGDRLSDGEEAGVLVEIDGRNRSLTSGNASNNSSTLLIFLAGNTISLPSAFSSIDANL